MIMKEKRLKELIRESVIEALTVEVDMEIVRDAETGKPLKHPKITKETVFLPSFMTQVLSFQEGALRGMQEDANKESNKIAKIYDSFPFLIECLTSVNKSLLELEAPKQTIKEIENEG